MRAYGSRETQGIGEAVALVAKKAFIAVILAALIIKVFELGEDGIGWMAAAATPVLNRLQEAALMFAGK